MKTPENINELIAKFFAGEEMTSLEKEQFQEWKKENNAEYSKLAGLIKQFDSSEPIINVNTSMVLAADRCKTGITSKVCV